MKLIGQQKKGIRRAYAGIPHFLNLPYKHLDTSPALSGLVCSDLGFSD